MVAASGIVQARKLIATPGRDMLISPAARKRAPFWLRIATIQRGSLVLSCEFEGLGRTGRCRVTGGNTHRRFQEGGTVVPDTCSGRADRREMVVPDPSRRVQRPQPFRAVPGRPGNRPQHPVRPAGKLVDGGILDAGPTLRPPQGHLFADRKGRGAAAGRPRASPMGRGMGPWHPGISSPTAATASRSGSCASADDGRQLKLGDLVWIDSQDRRPAPPRGLSNCPRKERARRPTSAAQLIRSRRPTGSGAAARRR